MSFFQKRSQALLLCIAFATVAFSIPLLKAYAKLSNEPEAPDLFAPMVYVSPTGDDSAQGTKEHPVASVKVALEHLAAKDAGTIILSAGIYTEQVSISRKGGAILIMAAPGEKVVFEGGQRLKVWRNDPERPNVYTATVSDRESLFGQSNYFDLWDDRERVRYGKVADLDAVEYWSGTTLLEGDKVSFHPHRKVAPEELDLWTNRRAYGIKIERDNVTLRNLHFRNYLGGSYARAVMILSGQGASVESCTFRNCAIGLTSGASDVTVSNCEFREVGNGVRQANKGKNIVVRNSLFEGAVGQFAFSDIDEHLSNGIRIYFYSDGATIEQCVTTGFWAGLYIKTISGVDGALPYTIKNNTFLDGIRSGADCRHPRTIISHNIIGTPRTIEGAGIRASYYLEMGATLQDNLFFGEESDATAPFVNLQEGDLRLKEARTVGATDQANVKWEPRTKKRLTPSALVKSDLKLLRAPIASASKEGAVVSVRLSREASVRFEYRKKGGGKWIEGPVCDATAYPATSMIAPIPFDAADSPIHYSYVCPLIGNELAEDAEYEYRMRYAKPGGKALPEYRGTFKTAGNPRTHHVAATADSELADGTARHPFPTLQDAFEQALPGDTVLLLPGIHSTPTVIRHGGRAGREITIKGQGWGKTIIDGGKRSGTLLDLKDAPHINVEDLEIRWFGNYGVTVEDSSHFTMVRCWIWNQGFSETGACAIGLQLTGSANATVKYSLFNRLQSAAIALRSPKLRFTNNTAFANVYSGLDLINSARDSIVTHNSLTFTGNRALYIQESDQAAFASLHCDYNNYASAVRQIAPKRPENDFTPSERYGPLSGQSKAIVAITMGADYWRDFHTMKDWMDFSGKDAHSLFADPQYAAPLTKDFHLLPESPNLLQRGLIIGALPAQSTP